MHNRHLSWVCLSLFILSFVLIPAVGAISNTIEIPASKDPLDRDRPENIAALKNHIAYVGESQEARMDGVISYISNISRNEGVEKLQQIRNDYLAAASTIPVMQTADEINAARDDMCVQSQLFAEETRNQIVMFKGTPEGMQESVTISLNTFEASLNGMTDSLWLSRQSARIIIFNRESQERTSLLRSLTENGTDTTQAQRLSDQIDSKRPELETALRNNKGMAVRNVNTAVKSLNQQFRNTIADYRTNLKIKASIALIKA
ncbi:hypothetical protein [uncultured Methanoregula sp.]|uniref:hypothetical protein n=1 Tax=uncultured Methanoregula sp. TaxID=1005933 RepID=UPI002AAC2482|nr:hypothetical protein [uncultured Methanoregula sp.]